MVKQIKPSESIKMLGILFDPAGIKRYMGNFDRELMRITKVPLKRQQRLKILRSFLIPRWYYKLSLSRMNIKTLRVMDKSMRGCIKKWISLPKDIPIAYINTSCNVGSMGIPSLATTIPYLIYSRMESLKDSSSRIVRSVYLSDIRFPFPPSRKRQRLLYQKFKYTYTRELRIKRP